MKHYLVSLPERTARAIAAGLGGLLYETSELLLPTAVRRSRLYQATVARVLRIAVELVGGVSDVYPPDDVSVQELATRKAAGNVVELASVVAVGWSPLWLLAAASDLTGGTRTYLRVLVAELQQARVLPEDVEVRSVEGLLDVIEQTSGVMADTIDVPPLNLRDMRNSWRLLQRNASELPDAADMARIFADLQEIAGQEGRSPLEVSSLVAAGAVRAGVQMGNVHIFDYYRHTLQGIASEGLSPYVRRIVAPYRTAAAGHFDPRHTTYTERLLQRFRT